VGEFDHLLLGGSKVLPAVVVFTKESADQTWLALKAVAPAAGALIVSAHKAGAGRPGERVVFHAKETSLATVQSAVQLLVGRGMRAAVFQTQEKLALLIQHGQQAMGMGASAATPPPSWLGWGCGQGSER
jgi:S-adenosylmethionine:tRNA-ribosyltransferase-isomerase (queuine synthetase)